MQNQQCLPQTVLLAGEIDIKTREALAGAGYVTPIADSVIEPQSLPQQRDIALIILHHKPPQLDAGAILTELRRCGDSTAAIIISDNFELSAAVEALRLGAADYLVAPVSAETLLARAHAAVHGTHDLAKDNTLDKDRVPMPFDLLWRHLRKRYGFDHMPSCNPELQACYRAAARVAKSNASVIIEGETGTGKEYLARTIHYLSNRRDAQLITINCGAIPEALLESELFGHEKGAFTSATARKIGLCEEAHRGTLFLDEIGEMPLPMQVKLLRFLQEQSFTRLGGTQTIDVDVRVIAATNRDLSSCIEQGLFREDLYYRLGVLSLHLPPLRSRPEDILPFAIHSLQRQRKREQSGVEGFSSSAKEALLEHDWPGNLRELDNAVQRGMLLAEGRLIETRHLMLHRAKQRALRLEMEVPRLHMAAG